MDVRLVRDILHADISRQQGFKLLKGVIDEIHRRQLSLLETFSLFGACEGVSEVLCNKAKMYRQLYKQLKKDKFWLIRTSASIADVISIDYCKFNSFTHDWEYTSRRLALMESGWKFLSKDVLEKEIPDRIKGDNLIDSDLFALLDFLDCHKYYYNGMFADFISSLKSYKPSVDTEAPLCMTPKY